MNILIEARNTVIPAVNYGGIPRVIWHLGKELDKMGHRVSYLVAKGSECGFGRIIEFNPGKPVADQIPESTDVVHFNSEVPEGFNTPYILTVHGNVDPGITLPINSVFVSRNHAERFGSASFVHNGFDWDDYGAIDLGRSRSHYHFLGKAAWRVKNIKGAIRVVRSLPGAKLEVLGGTRLNVKMGFRFTLNSNIRFRGMVGDQEKKNVMERSKGLIFPVTWQEPFGLAITESLYFGCPVFATPYGSIPELVTSEVGFLSDKRIELVNHIKGYGDQYSIRKCHEYARDLFNSRIMAERYVEKYAAVMDGRDLNSSFPVATDTYRNCMWID